MYWNRISPYPQTRYFLKFHSNGTGLAAESAFCLCADAGQTLIMLQQASMDDNK